jgi:hypothetical protein
LHQRIQDFDANSVSMETVHALAPFYNNPDLTYENVGCWSMLAGRYIKFIRAFYELKTQQ